MNTIGLVVLDFHKRIESGELLFLNIDKVGISSLSGKYKSDHTLRKICDDAYEL
jgi:hypothetical protein